MSDIDCPACDAPPYICSIHPPELTGSDCRTILTEFANSLTGWREVMAAPVWLTTELPKLDGGTLEWLAKKVEGADYERAEVADDILHVLPCPCEDEDWFVHPEPDGSDPAAPTTILRRCIELLEESEETCWHPQRTHPALHRSSTRASTGHCAPRGGG